MTTLDDDERIKQIGRALGNAIQAVAINERALSFSEVVREYKRVEEDFVAQANGNAFHVLETRRRIAERILVAAHRFEQSFDICQEQWNTLCTLGFTTPSIKRQMTWFYADCCLFDDHYEAGISVIEPVIAEFEQWLAETPVNEDARSYYDEELARLKSLRDELKVGCNSD